VPEPQPAAPIIVRLLQLAAGGTTPFDGQYLVEYDPTRTGTGPAGERLRTHLVCTADPGQARQFADITEAHGYCTAPSGQPYPADRPLTAYHVEIAAAPPHQT
jgi:hypothetical protein